jgi:serine/threonine protein kinase
MPPVTSKEPQESASISGVILGIIIGAAVVLLISLFVSCRLLLVKTSTWHESPTVAKTSDIGRTNNTTLQGMTLAPTNIGISIPASKSVNETDFIITGQLGKGGGGDVFFAIPGTNSLRKYGERIVAKRFKKTYNSMNPNEKSMFDQEIGIMEMLGGRGHFAELIGYALNPCTILMKLYSLGSLSSFMKKMDVLWSKTVKMSFAQDIFEAVGIMHKLELAHCDLKPDNILIDENHYGRYTCVLTDFGITQILSDSIIDAKAFIAFNVRGLSVRYAAPEAFLRFRTKSEFIKANEIKAGDLYSLATIVYEMLTRRHPWA